MSTVHRDRTEPGGEDIFQPASPYWWVRHSTQDSLPGLCQPARDVTDTTQVAIALGLNAFLPSFCKKWPVSYIIHICFSRHGNESLDISWNIKKIACVCRERERERLSALTQSTRNTVVTRFSDFLPKAEHTIQSTVSQCRIIKTANSWAKFFSYLNPPLTVTTFYSFFGSIIRTGNLMFIYF
jgi:hypothetical protein